MELTNTQWSQTYFSDLTLTQHSINNKWFEIMLEQLKPTGQLYVPILNKSFNKLGEEVDNTMAKDQHYFTLKEDIV